MPSIKTQQRTSCKTRRGGGIGTRLALVLAILLVVRTGGPALAHDVVQLALAALEAAGCGAGVVAALAIAALTIRFTALRWRDRSITVITDAAWPRPTYTDGGQSWS